MHTNSLPLSLSYTLSRTKTHAHAYPRTRAHTPQDTHTNARRRIIPRRHRWRCIRDRTGTCTAERGELCHTASHIKTRGTYWRAAATATGGGGEDSPLACPLCAYPLYAHPHIRTSASRWIAETAPRHSAPGGDDLYTWPLGTVTVHIYTPASTCRVRVPG